MKIGLFGGTFDPVHSQHVQLCEHAVCQLELDKLIILPSANPPHKDGGNLLSRTDAHIRLEMAKTAFRQIDCAQVDSFELQSAEPSYTYITAEHFAQKFAGSQLFFIMGADSLLTFDSWKCPERILRSARLAVCYREGTDSQAAMDRAKALGDRAVLFNFSGNQISSTKLRTFLEFGIREEGLSDAVFDFIQKHQLYAEFAHITAQLKQLITPKKYLHSAHTAYQAVKLAKRTGYPQKKAFLAAALHDCAKSISAERLLALGYKLRTDLPDSVQHAFAGRFLASRLFGIDDIEVLQAVEYHTTGRANMTLAEKILYVADLIEQTRHFAGIEELRQAVYRDFEEGFRLCLAKNVEFLFKKRELSDICPLTLQAYEFYVGKTGI